MFFPKEGWLHMLHAANRKHLGKTSLSIFSFLMSDWLKFQPVVGIISNALRKKYNVDICRSFRVNELFELDESRDSFIFLVYFLPFFFSRFQFIRDTEDPLVPCLHPRLADAPS